MSIPKVVILDLKKEVEAFESAVTRVTTGTAVTPSMLIGSLWDAMADPKEREVEVDTLTNVWLRDPRLDGPRAGMLFSSAMIEMGAAIGHQLDFHRLYEGDARLPYEIEVRPDKVVVLKYDEAAAELQAEWGKANQALEEEILDDLEWMD